jgi:hypothetical protein
VEGGDGDSRVVVTLTRNGTVARTALVDLSRFLPGTSASGKAPAMAKTEEGQGKAADRGDLLTAVAAVILTEMAQRHPKLEEGLCGAKRWESVAAHVVATKPPASQGGRELRRELLAYAVDRDPRNSLALLAYANLLGEGASSPAEIRRHVRRLRTIRVVIERRAGDRRGYWPLRLRALHTLTAAQLNLAAAESGAARRDAALAAGRTFGSLAQLLTIVHAAAVKDGNRGQIDFTREMTLVAAELRAAVKVLVRPPAERPRELAQRLPKLDGQAPVSLHVLYDQACRFAFVGSPAASLRRLRLASGLEGYRRMARSDPWFARIRDVDGVPTRNRERFWEIVGSAEPVSEFTGLPIFGEKGAGLRAVGLTGAPEFCAATTIDAQRQDLGKVLGVPLGVVEGWHCLALLAKPDAAASAETRWLTTRELRLLLAEGIASEDDARRGILQRPLETRARELGIRPLDDAEFQEVAARAARPLRTGRAGTAPAGAPGRQ